VTKKFLLVQRLAMKGRRTDDAVCKRERSDQQPAEGFHVSPRRVDGLPFVMNVWRFPGIRHVPRNAYKEDVQEWADMTGEMTNHVRVRLYVFGRHPGLLAYR
jgi:hypothetical protein